MDVATQIADELNGMYQIGFDEGALVEAANRLARILEDAGLADRRSFLNVASVGGLPVVKLRRKDQELVDTLNHLVGRTLAVDDRHCVALIASHFEPECFDSAPKLMTDVWQQDVEAYADSNPNSTWAYYVHDERASKDDDLDWDEGSF